MKKNRNVGQIKVQATAELSTVQPYLDHGFNDDCNQCHQCHYLGHEYY